MLIGSRTIRNSMLLAERLTAAGLPLELLNGRQDRGEAEIIALAGRRGAVTIATNMAGRGTDITLGPGVVELGGMHVIGVECHESARIDRQLLGRAGRQGDPGSGRFFVSADDPLLVRYAPSLSKRMQRMPSTEGEIAADLSADVLAAQGAGRGRRIRRPAANARTRPLDGRDGDDAGLRAGRRLLLGSLALGFNSTLRMNGNDIAGAMRSVEKHFKSQFARLGNRNLQQPLYRSVSQPTLA